MEAPTCNSVYLFVADSIRNEDERQDAYTAILTERPQTYAEAMSVLSRLHHRKEYKARRSRELTNGKVHQLNFDPTGLQLKDTDGDAMAALERLPDAERRLIEDHVIEGTSLREIAQRDGVSKDTIRRRYDRAAEKVRQIVKSSAPNT